MQDFFRGVGRAIGIIVGFLPTAVSFGAIAVQAGVSYPATVAMSVWIFAGASQFAAVEGIRQGLPWFSIVLTVLVINLRHVPMSLAAVRRIYGQFSRGKQWLLCHGIVDETFALEMSDEQQPFAFYLGMHLCCWASWVAGTWMGTQVGMQIPARWLQFALPALFLYLLVGILQRFWTRNVWVVLAIGLGLVLGTTQWGSTGILIAIVGVAIAASLLLSDLNSLKGSETR